jgi:uncharacterized membrane protein YtjA (UPF0391 family)
VLLRLLVVGGYDGAWGFTGAAAESAYLARTAHWTGRFREVR